jgi:Lipocalin-like domain
MLRASFSVFDPETDIRALWSKWLVIKLKFRRRALMRIHLGVALIVLLSPAATANDASIVGTWKFQSFVREVSATGKRQNDFGEKPGGYISYQPDGRMFAVLVAGNRIKPAGALMFLGIKAGPALIRFGSTR